MGQKTVNHTLRIDKEPYDILVQEARIQNLTLSSLINKVLTRYARNDRFVVRNRVMGISPRPVLTTLLDFISEDEMEEAGRRIGETHPKDVLTVSGFAIDATSFMPLLEIIADYGFWCMLERPSKPFGSQIYHLRHDLGTKWTRFLTGYVESAKKLLGLSITIDWTEFTVTISVQNKPI